MTQKPTAFNKCSSLLSIKGCYSLWFLVPILLCLPQYHCEKVLHPLFSLQSTSCEEYRRCLATRLCLRSQENSTSRSCYQGLSAQLLNKVTVKKKKKLINLPRNHTLTKKHNMLINLNTPKQGRNPNQNQILII